MEDINDKEISKLWKENKKNLIKPNVLYALDKYNILYYVYRDDSLIIFLIPSDCDSTFVIPKKYCNLSEQNGNRYYSIMDSGKLQVVSCSGTKNKYEKFILEKFVTNPKC